MLCNRQPTPVEDGMQPLLPSRHMGGRLGLCDGHHIGGHEWKEAFPGVGLHRSMQIRDRGGRPRFR